jgi:hypothetical protein
MPRGGPEGVRPCSSGDYYSGSMKLTTHWDHMSHCKTASCTHWSNKWTYREYMDQLVHIGRIDGPTDLACAEERSREVVEEGRVFVVQERQRVERVCHRLSVRG